MTDRDQPRRPVDPARTPSESTPGAAEADLAEQRRDIVDDAADPRTEEITVPDDVNPADAHEQHLTLDYDDDEYR